MSNFFIFIEHNINMRKYNKEVIKILKNSEIEAINLKHNYVGTEHMILSLLKTKKNLRSI